VERRKGRTRKSAFIWQRRYKAQPARLEKGIKKTILVENRSRRRKQHNYPQPWNTSTLAL
jgi:hypothetical protein